MVAERGRCREYGIVIGRHEPGVLNAITDVAGVRVGHKTVVREGDERGAGAVRTGVTAVWPHAGPIWRERVFVGTSIVNGWGELIGINQLNEWGILHSPIVLTSSLSIGAAYDAAARWIASIDSAQGRSELIMPVVTECNDGFLSDARVFPVCGADVVEALESAHEGQVEEGCVGAGTGTMCFEFKGGIGTASRKLSHAQVGYTVGVLVQTNFGHRRDLLICGVPVGREINDFMPVRQPDGSCVVVIATDAPLLPHQLRRVAARGGLALARCGSIGEDASGELIIAFSTAQVLPSRTPDSTVGLRALLDGADEGYLTPINLIFTATMEAVEEAVLNAMFAATTTVGRDGHVLHALPIVRTLEILSRHSCLEGPR